MLDGRGSLAQNGGNVVCPLHRWTYSGEGALMGAPRFPAIPSSNHRTKGLKAWNRLLFDGPWPGGDLAALSRTDAADARFLRRAWSRLRLQLEDLRRGLSEDYHVGPFHRGLGSSSPATIWREWGREFPVQTVGLSRLRQTRLAHLQALATSR